MSDCTLKWPLVAHICVAKNSSHLSNDTYICCKSLNFPCGPWGEYKNILRPRNFNTALTHWGLVMDICICKLTIIVSDNGLSPGWQQAHILTSAEILSVEPLGTNLSEILIEIHTFLLMQMHLKMSSGKWQPFCLGLSVLSITMVTEETDLNRTYNVWFWGLNYEYWF